jgi:hypothetical protein
MPKDFQPSSLPKTFLVLPTSTPYFFTSFCAQSVTKAWKGLTTSELWGVSSLGAKCNRFKQSKMRELEGMTLAKMQGKARCETLKVSSVPSFFVYVVLLWRWWQQCLHLLYIWKEKRQWQQCRFFLFIKQNIEKKATTMCHYFLLWWCHCKKGVIFIVFLSLFEKKKTSTIIVIFFFDLVSWKRWRQLQLSLPSSSLLFIYEEEKGNDSCCCFVRWFCCK